MSRRLQLVQLLEGYSPGAGEERPHARMLVLAQESADVLSRYHFDPGHFTVSGFVVSPDVSQLLLVHHTRLAKWLQPGGHIEPDDEDLESVARREIAEESLLPDLALVGSGLFDIDVHEIPAARGEPHHEHHDLRFLYEAEGEPAPGDGVSEVAWVPLDAVEARTSDVSVRRAVKKLINQKPPTS